MGLRSSWTSGRARSHGPGVCSIPILLRCSKRSDMEEIRQMCSHAFFESPSRQSGASQEGSGESFQILGLLMDESTALCTDLLRLDGRTTVLSAEPTLVIRISRRSERHRRIISSRKLALYLEFRCGQEFHRPPPHPGGNIIPLLPCPFIPICIIPFGGLAYPLAIIPP